jgi:hypothetical protein
MRSVIELPQAGRNLMDSLAQMIEETQAAREMSYPRFVELLQEALVPLCAYLQTRKGTSQGVAFIDSTLLAVCHPKRSARHKVFAGFAAWGKSSLG